MDHRSRPCPPVATAVAELARYTQLACLSGLLWQCSCSHYNAGPDPACENCQTPKPPRMLPPGQIPACACPVDFFAALITWPEEPDPLDTPPIPGPEYDPARLRVARAGDVVERDLIVGAVGQAPRLDGLQVASYHWGTYEAAPEPVDPSHRCGVCDTFEGRPSDELVVIHPDPPNWPGVCDPAARDELLLIVPRALR